VGGIKPIEKEHTEYLHFFFFAISLTADGLSQK